jgi:hypothetical protein
MARRPEWIVPNKSASEADLVGWLKEQVQQADNYLKSQRAYSDIDLAMDIIAGEESERIPEGRSDAYSNRLKRGIREVVASESTIRHFAGYRSRSKGNYDHTADILNRLGRGWYRSTFADQGLKQALQWASVAGTAWLCPLWELEFGSYGAGEINLYSYGPRDLKPSQIGRDHDIQKAYMSTIVAELPINFARLLHPLHADKIVPDRAQPTWARKGMSFVGRNLPWIHRLFGGEKEESNVGGPTIDIHYSYIMDGSINETKYPIQVGKPGSSWEYTVPYLGQDIPTNLYQGGQPVMRKADWEDVRIYPRRRLVVWTNHGVLSDDTNPYWHGKVPAIRVSVDKWPWEFLGFSLIRDGYPLQKSFNRILRAIDDATNGRLNPSMAYDSNILDKGVMDRFDPRVGGRHIPIDNAGLGGPPMSPLVPEQFYNIEQGVFKHLDTLRDELDYVMVVKDMAAVMKANQIPSDQTIDKLLELAGPLVADIGRGMERVVTELGVMMGSNFFQFYDAQRRYSLLGKDGVTTEDFDYDPGSLIPSHIVGENPAIPSPTSQGDRARWYSRQFMFEVDPGTMLDLNNLTRKMGLMQLWRAGFPIDPWTLAEAWGIENFGPAPEGANTVIQKWAAWLKESSQFTAVITALAQLKGASVMAQAGVMPQQTNGAPAPPTGAPGQEQKGPGRPPSAGAAPHIEQKDGGTRSTVSESK